MFMFACLSSLLYSSSVKADINEQPDGKSVIKTKWLAFTRNKKYEYQIDQFNCPRVNHPIHRVVVDMTMTKSASST